MSTCLITFTIRVLLPFFIPALFFVSCYSTPKQQTVTLTRSMLKNYKITPENLNRYQFYLGKNLVLQGDTTIYTNKLSSRNPNSVNMVARTERRTIVFPPGTPGRVLSADNIAGVTGKYVSIKINFGLASGGKNYNLVLSFSPDLNGNYTLDHGWIFNDIRLKRRGIKYDCIDGCWNNYLLVSGTENKFQVPIRWQATGNTYPAHSSGSRP